MKDEFAVTGHRLVMSIGDGGFWLVAQFVDGFSLITPKDIALQIIMFALTTVVLGGGYHQFVVKPQYRRQQERLAQQMGPFRRMLVMRIAGVHSSLYSILADDGAFSRNWGRPTIRNKFVGKVSALYANLCATVLTNTELLQDNERLAVGAYTERLFELQRQFQHIESRLRNLSAGDVARLRSIVNDANACIADITDAFDEVEEEQVSEMLWNEEFFASIQLNLYAKLEGKVATQCSVQSAADTLRQLGTPTPSTEDTSSSNRSLETD